VDAADLGAHRAGKFVPRQQCGGEGQYLALFGETIALDRRELMQRPGDYVDMGTGRLPSSEHGTDLGDRCGGARPVETFGRLGRRHATRLDGDMLGEHRW
jgi:hypothetical protein